jgi:HPt (histidine-containing phosphotransfer) domain-containing protein
LFQSNVPSLLAAMQSAAADGNAQELQNAAHSLKGAAAGLGARRMTALSEKLEAMGSDNTLQEADAIIAAVASEYHQVLAILQAEAGEAE